MPNGFTRWTASIAEASISSSTEGRTDDMTAVTARPHETMSPNVAATVETGGGSGRSRSVASVMTPRVPSDPTKRRFRS